MRNPALCAFIAIVVLGCGRPMKAIIKPLPFRRYVDEFELRPSVNLLTDTKLFLLTLPQVQKELTLSRKQADAIRQGSRGSSPEPRAQIAAICQAEGKREGIAGVLSQEAEAVLAATLTEQQASRLDELLLQMRGPLLILYHSRLETTLGITSRQKQAMSAICRNAHPPIASGTQEVGRGLFAGAIPPGSNTSSEALRRRAAAVAALVRRRDGALVEVLTARQEAQLSASMGETFSATWEWHESFIMSEADPVGSK